MKLKHGLSIKARPRRHGGRLFTPGVASAVQVRSHVQVAAPANGERMRRADAAIKADVERTLRGRPFTRRQLDRREVGRKWSRPLER